MLSLLAPLSVVIVVIVPAGDWSVMSRSLEYVWVRFVNRSRSVRYAPAPATSIVDVTTAGPVGIAVGVVFSCDVVTAVPQPGGAGGATAWALEATASMTSTTTEVRRRRSMGAPDQGPLTFR